MFKSFRASLIACVLLSVALVVAQQSKPLSNDDVVSMTKNHLPESVIINAIQANETQFDTSANGLIALQKAGVSQSVMDAMLAAQKNKRNTAASAATASAPASSGPAASGQPAVNLLQENSKLPLALEKTQVAQTKAKANSLGALATDAALTQALQVGVQQAAWSAAAHSGSYAGASAVNAAGGVMGGIMGHRKPSFTYVWAIPTPKSATTVASNTPAFEVNYAGIPGINPDEFEPSIVKLVPTSNNWRLVGATEAKQDIAQGTDWQLYSSFVEQRMPTQNKKTAPGQAQISPSSALAPGEYGIVLRPVNKSKKFAGSDIAQNQGEGVLFNSVWSFAVK
ncbi:MAG TPA: hypothetical protein VFA76_14615 [Terriglobales bacterium]|nr:hypothetical protein [Terriglobales bacterium]